MIIFQGHPSRLYPKVLSNILDNTNFDDNEFFFPFLVKKDIDIINSNNLLNGVTKKCKHKREGIFLYGIFHSCLLNIEQNDFIFTLLNHPVDQVYELYAFYRFLGESNTNELSDYGRNQNKIINELPHISLEKFIDLILEDSDFVFSYKNIKYYPMTEAVYGFNDYNYFNYIGKTSHINHLFHTLNVNFNLNIPFLNNYRVNSFIGDRPKENLLIKKFKKQIDFYNKLDIIYDYKNFS